MPVCIVSIAGTFFVVSPPITIMIAQEERKKFMKIQKFKFEPPKPNQRVTYFTSSSFIIC